MDDDNSPPVDPWDFVEKLEYYGNSKEFTVDGLREQLDLIPKNVIEDVVIQCTNIMLCECKNISVEVIECLLEYHPEAISSKCSDETSYPLHYACENCCTHDVIAFLMEKHPAALHQFSVLNEGVDTEDVYGYEDSYGVSGLPLHYYLSRPSNDIDMKTVIMLVNAYPESITKPCENTGLKPIDILLSRGIFLEFRTYCTTKSMTVDGLRERINNIPQELYNHVQEHFNLLQMVCLNENTTLEVVEYILKEYDANGASRALDARCKWIHPNPAIAYPLHFACKSKSCPNSIVQLLAERYPAALSHVSVINGGVHIEHQRRDPRMDDHDICGLPLHYYLSREENIDIDTVKRMVELYPNALLGSENAWFNSILYAPLDVLLMNPSIDNSFEIAQYLIETNAESIRRSGGDSSLQIACSSCRVDPKVIGLIIEARPELLRHQDGGRNTPIHNLIVNRSYSENGMSISESVATEIAALMGKKEPALLRIVNQNEALPLHLAARNGKSPQFCKILVDGYKESTTVSVNGHLSLHLAAYGNHLDTVKYLFDANPSTLDTHNSDGKLFFRNESIERNTHVKIFLEAQWPYYVQAKRNHTSALTIRDSDGQVPLHHALYDKNASLGSIKLLLEANPDSLFIADNNDTMPLHVACGRSAESAEYLVDYFAASFGEERRPNIMLKKDKWGNTPLHYACYYGKCDVVKVLLGKQKHTVTVSERNSDGKLPIHLFCDPPRIGFYKRRIDPESVEYTEALWLLLRNCPETVVNW